MEVLDGWWRGCERVDVGPVVCACAPKRVHRVDAGESYIPSEIAGVEFCLDGHFVKQFDDPKHPQADIAHESHTQVSDIWSTLRGMVVQE